MKKQIILIKICVVSLTQLLINGKAIAQLEWKMPIVEATAGQKDVEIDYPQVQNSEKKEAKNDPPKESAYQLQPIAVPGRVLKPKKRFKKPIILPRNNRLKVDNAVPNIMNNKTFRID